MNKEGDCKLASPHSLERMQITTYKSIILNVIYIYSYPFSCQKGIGVSFKKKKKYKSVKQTKE